MKLFFLLLLSLVIFSCSKPADLQKDEIYKIISEVFIDQNEHVRSVCATFDTVDLAKYAKNWDESDIEFYHDQKAGISNFSIGKNKIQSFVKGFNGNKPFYLNLDRNCNDGIVNEISYPLISRDRTKIILSIQHVCHGGFLCGSGRVIYCVKKNGKWVLKDTYDEWIS